MQFNKKKKKLSPKDTPKFSTWGDTELYQPTGP